MLEPNYLHTAFLAIESNVHAEAMALEESKQIFKQALQRLNILRLPEIEQKFNSQLWTGARPVLKEDSKQSIVNSFSQKWDNYQDMYAWAENTLAKKAIAVVNSDYILPEWNDPFQIGCVHVGLFKNYHEPREPFRTNLEIVLITAGEAIRNKGVLSDQREYFEWRSFQLEVDKLVDYMEDAEDFSLNSLCLYPHSLINPLYPMPTNRQEQYYKVINELLESSYRTEVPILGYIEAPYHQEMISGLAHLFSIPIHPLLCDSMLLHEHMRWGDYSQVWTLNDKYYSWLTPSNRVAFCYLKVSPLKPPVRLEFPVWFIEKGIVDQIVNLIFAESIIGSFKPHSLIMAAKATNLNDIDRKLFSQKLTQITEQRNA